MPTRIPDSRASTMTLSAPRSRSRWIWRLSSVGGGAYGVGPGLGREVEGAVGNLDSGKAQLPGPLEVRDADALEHSRLKQGAAGIHVDTGRFDTLDLAPQHVLVEEHRGAEAELDLVYVIAAELQKVLDLVGALTAIKHHGEADAARFHRAVLSQAGQGAVPRLSLVHPVYPPDARCFSACCATSARRPSSTCCKVAPHGTTTLCSPTSISCSSRQHFRSVGPLPAGGMCRGHISMYGGSSP